LSRPAGCCRGGQPARVDGRRCLTAGWCAPAPGQLITVRSGSAATPRPRPPRSLPAARNRGTGSIAIQSLGYGQPRSQPSGQQDHAGWRLPGQAGRLGAAAGTTTVTWPGGKRNGDRSHRKKALTLRRQPCRLKMLHQPNSARSPPSRHTISSKAPSQAGGRLPSRDCREPVRARRGRASRRSRGKSCSRQAPVIG
jgi:hypothetical protein